MINHTRLALFYAVLFGLASACFGAEPETKSDIKDEFLRFTLEKAKQYSEAGEAAIEKAVDVAQREAPELAKEWLRWRLWKHGMVIAFAVISIIWIGFFVIYCFRHGGPEESFASAIAAFVPAFLMLLTGPLWCGEVMKFIQILVAPRIYIAEQLLALVK